MSNEWSHGRYAGALAYNSPPPSNATTLAEPTSTPYGDKSSEEWGNKKFLPAVWGWGHFY